METIKKTLVPAALGSIGSILIYKFVLQSDLSITVPFTSFEMPAWAAIGITSMIGNSAGEVLAEVVGPKIPKLGFLAGFEDKVIPPALGAVVSYGIFRMAVSEDTNLKNTVLVSIGGNIAGKYAYEMI